MSFYCRIIQEINFTMVLIGFPGSLNLKVLATESPRYDSRINQDGTSH